MVTGNVPRGSATPLGRDADDPLQSTPFLERPGSNRQCLGKGPKERAHPKIARRQKNRQNQIHQDNNFREDAYVALFVVFATFLGVLLHSCEAKALVRFKALAVASATVLFTTETVTINYKLVTNSITRTNGCVKLKKA